jgi:hypothetical protein
MTLKFKLSVPVAWVELDLNPATRARTIGDIVAERGGAGQQLGLSPGQLTDLLENLAGQARAQNGVYAAFYSDVMEGAPVSASLIVSILPGSGGAPPPGTDPMSVARVLQQMFPADADVQLRELAAGPAIRVRRQLEAPIADAGTLAVENVQYVVVFPDLMQLALLDFSTPTIGLADAFVELFDAIAETLAWT